MRGGMEHDLLVWRVREDVLWGEGGAFLRKRESQSILKKRRGGGGECEST